MALHRAVPVSFALRSRLWFIGHLLRLLQSCWPLFVMPRVAAESVVFQKDWNAATAFVSLTWSAASKKATRTTMPIWCGVGQAGRRRVQSRGKSSDLVPAAFVRSGCCCCCSSRRRRLGGSEDSAFQGRPERASPPRSTPRRSSRVAGSFRRRRRRHKA